MARHANGNWDLPEGCTWEQVGIAVLMDIRDRLDRIGNHTNVLVCRNTQDIPRILRKIAANTDRYRCADHPRYKAIRPPRTDCKECRRMFRRRNP